MPLAWRCDRTRVDPVLADDLDALLGPDPTDWLAISGHRPTAEQAANYQKGRTPFATLAELMASDPHASIIDPDAVVTNAKPGSSPHSPDPSEAVDLAERVNGTQVQDYARPCWPRLWTLVRAAPRLHSGIDFPGNFKDPPHVQRVDWRTYAHFPPLSGVSP